MKVDRRLLLNFDWTLFGMVLAICAIGLMNIYSTGYSLADARHSQLYIKQMQSLTIGILASLFTAITFTRLLVITWFRKKRPAQLGI